jgi:hypothetical protein
LIPFEYLNLHSHAPVCVSFFRAYLLLHAGYISGEADCFGVFSQWTIVEASGSNSQARPTFWIPARIELHLVGHSIE